MKTIAWSDWTRQRRAMAGAAAEAADRAGSLRGRRDRVRTPEEREMIVRGTVALVRRREREGRLVQVGPRRYEIR